MKNKILLNFALLLSIISLSGCDVIGAIFKGGVWTGVILVVGIILLIIFIISRMSRK